MWTDEDFDHENSAGSVAQGFGHGVILLNPAIEATEGVDLQQRGIDLAHPASVGREHLALPFGAPGRRRQARPRHGHGDRAYRARHRPHLGPVAIPHPRRVPRIARAEQRGELRVHGVLNGLPHDHLHVRLEGGSPVHLGVSPLGAPRQGRHGWWSPIHREDTPSLFSTALGTPPIAQLPGVSDTADARDQYGWRYGNEDGVPPRPEAGLAHVEEGIPSTAVWRKAPDLRRSGLGYNDHWELQCIANGSTAAIDRRAERVGDREVRRQQLS